MPERFVCFGSFFLRLRKTQFRENAKKRKCLSTTVNLALASSIMRFSAVASASSLDPLRRWALWLRSNAPLLAKAYFPTLSQHPRALWRRASNKAADIKQRLRRHHLLRPKKERPLWTDYKSPLMPEEKVKMQRQLQILLQKREELRAITDERVAREKDNDNHAELDEGAVLTLDDVSIKDLTTLANTVSKKAEELKLQLPYSAAVVQGDKKDQKSVLVAAVSKVTVAITGAASMVPEIPWYLATNAQHYLSNSKGSGVGELASLFKTHPTAEGDYDWRRAASRRRGYSKSTVDARTRFCVNSLRGAGPSETRCLRRLEALCTHLHEFPYGKGVAVREGVVGELLAIRQRTNNPSIVIQANEALELIGHQDPLPRRGIRVLSLDGGGMRGLVALEVLGAVEVRCGGRGHDIRKACCLFHT